MLGDMHTILSTLANRQPLDSVQITKAMDLMIQGNVNGEQSSAFLTAFLMRPITLPEIATFRYEIQKRQVPINLDTFDFVDLCGTGGDGKNTVNISTLTAFVVAASGYTVAKHGNYGVSSKMGSSNILEALGYTFKRNEDDLKRELESTNLTFIHAPLFNPAIKSIAKTRKNLGIKTFFNILGPLLHPAHPQKQVVGVFNRETQRLYKYLFQQTDTAFTIVHSLDGYDEVSLTSNTKVITRQEDRVLTPSDFGFEKIAPEEICATQDSKLAAKQFVEILQGKASEALTRVIAANAALAIQHYEDDTLSNISANAVDVIRSGRAMQLLYKLIT
jgi:anthranilate phosphoribosyltransferase